MLHLYRIIDDKNTSKPALIDGDTCVEHIEIAYMHDESTPNSLLVSFINPNNSANNISIEFYFNDFDTYVSYKFIINGDAIENRSKNGGDIILAHMLITFLNKYNRLKDDISCRTVINCAASLIKKPLFIKRMYEKMFL